jgi:ATP-dependent RNA helicase DeaD
MDAASDTTPPATFDVIPLSPDVRRAVDDAGYTHPTPVQRAVFESASRGRDLVVQARTGTGKTAAFGLPLIDTLVRKKDTVQALILCPTRELALQVTRELDRLSKHRGTRVVAVYGGAPMPRQIEQIRDGAQILVGTPGRVLDHLSRGTLDGSTIRCLVLDESDEMLSMGFLPQINEILSYLPESRQTLLFSATLPPDIKRMAQTRLRDPEFITLSGDAVGALQIRHFVYLSRGDKLSELLQVITADNPESAVVFCNTRDETKRVAAALQQEGYAADWLNADLAQNDREKVMAATRESRLRFLVATDVAARGIDISHLTHVINFDFPETAEAYVHRTGRTGRAGRTGTAISLIEPSDIGNLYLLRLTYKLRPIERNLPTETELKTRAETDLVRWFVDGLASRKVHPEDLALARRLLSHERAELVVAALLRDHLGARPDAQDEAAAARRARTPRAADPQPEERRAPPQREERPQRAERPQREERPRAERPDREERPQRAERPDREERPQRAERPDREAVAATPERQDRPERAERAERAERGERRDRGDRAPRPPRPRDDDPVSYTTQPLPPEARPLAREPRAAEPRPPREPRPAPEPRAAEPRPPREPRPAPEPRAAEPRPPREPRPAPEPRAAEPRPPREPRPAPEPRPEPADDDSVVELYASAGRRQGAKPSDYERQLKDAGIGPESVAYVRVRHRNAFVGIDRAVAELALSALDGATIAGSLVKAELSRGRSAVGENDAAEPVAEE